MKKILIIFSLIICEIAFATPELYEKNPNVKTESVTIGEKTFFTFGFRDNKGDYHEWKWSNNTEKLNELSKAFGLYNKNPKNFTYYPEELPKALYKDHFIMGVLPDYSALVEHYYHTVDKLYENWKLFSNKANLSQRESLELLLRFFQDFPYGVPPTTYDRRLISGLFVPPLVFKNGWADCDSKSLLMATVLSHDPAYRNKLAMILVPGHALLGLNIFPQVYDETYTFQNKKYVVAEPTGLGRTPLGRKNSPYSKLLAIEPIYISVPTKQYNDPSNDTSSDSFATNTESTTSPSWDTELKILSNDDCKDGALLIDYVSPSQNIRIQMCQLKVNGEFIKHGPEVLFDTTGNPATLNIYNRGEKI